MKLKGCSDFAKGMKMIKLRTVMVTVRIKTVILPTLCGLIGIMANLLPIRPHPWERNTVRLSNMYKKMIHEM